MSHSSIPRMSKPRVEEAPKAKTPFLIGFLSLLLAIYIGFIGYWLITGETPFEETEVASAEIETSAVISELE